MRTRPVNSLVAAFLLFLFGASANAALIETDWLSPSDGLITYDDVTDLEWLDWTIANGRSILDVSTEFDPGGEFEGFRYATLPEVEALLETAFPGLFFATGAPEVFADDNLLDGVFGGFVDLFGLTQPLPGIGENITRAAYDRRLDPFPSVWNAIGIGDRFGSNPIDFISTATTLSETGEVAGWGHALVRSVGGGSPTSPPPTSPPPPSPPPAAPVPAPGTTVFLAALGMLCLYRRLRIGH